jgi:hypothetical protein
VNARNDLTGSAIHAGRRVNVDATTRVNVWPDMADAIDDVINAGPEYLNAASTREGNAEWSGSDTFTDAVNMLQNGWDEHRAAVEFAVSTVADDPSIEEMMATRFGWTHDFAGGMVDIGRYVVGEPECMIAPMMVEARQPDAVVRIMLNGSASAAVKTHVLVQRGIVVAALVDTLQKLGRGVEVWWTCQSSSGDARHANAVMVKSIDEPLDLDDLLFVAANPAMLRRFGFALWECESPETRKAHDFHFGYGQPTDLTRDEWSTVVDGTVHVAFGSVHANDDYSDPVAHVLKHLHGLDF